MLGCFWPRGAQRQPLYGRCRAEGRRGEQREVWWVFWCYVGVFLLSFWCFLCSFLFFWCFLLVFSGVYGSLGVISGASFFFKKNIFLLGSALAPGHHRDGHFGRSCLFPGQLMLKTSTFGASKGIPKVAT